MDKVAYYGVFGRGAEITGTVIARDEPGYYVVDWDMGTWSEYRYPEVRPADELMVLG